MYHTVTSDFSGDIGGSLGLFLGASFLTFFEVFDAFVFEWLVWKKDRLNKDDRNKIHIDDTKVDIDHNIEEAKVKNTRVVRFKEKFIKPYLLARSQFESEEVTTQGTFTWNIPNEAFEPRPATSKSRKNSITLHSTTQADIFYDTTESPFCVTSRPNSAHPYSWAHR